MIEGIEHIGIAVKDVEHTLKLYASIFGLKPEEITVLEDYGLKVGSIQIGDTKLEFLESIRQDTPIAKFIEKRGQGIHHVCFQVDDIEKTLKRLAKDGIELVDTTPRPGARGDKIAFIHPRSTSGILIELCEV